MPAGKSGVDRAEEVMELAGAHGWRMLMDPNSATWVKLELWRGGQYLQLNWKTSHGPGSGWILADTRQYRGPGRDTRSFTLAAALRIIAAGTGSLPPER